MNLEGNSAHPPSLTSKDPRYVIITPARDEEKFIEQTIRSVVKQTVLPAQWIIVNDGSTDRTGAIIDEFGRQYPWIRPRHRQDRGYRKAGGGVIEAFYDGYNELTCSDWEYLVKLDGDLTLPEDYFEKSIRRFDQDPLLGIGGGTICHLIDGALGVEECPKFHVRGATKIYRKDCWNAIHGLWPAPGWDTIDEVKANMLGWKTYSFPELQLVHHRLTGSAEGSWRGRVKNGHAEYVSGYHPLYAVARSLSNMARKPYVLGSIAMLYGFFRSYLCRAGRVNDPELIKYLQDQQMRRLCCRTSIWR